MREQRGERIEEIIRGEKRKRRGRRERIGETRGETRERREDKERGERRRREERGDMDYRIQLGPMVECFPTQWKLITETTLF